MLGALLFMFAEHKGISIPNKTDLLFPIIAMEGHLGISVAILFIVGLIASAYSSADSALTALTTSFCVDILNFEKKGHNEKKVMRRNTHIGMSLLLLVVIVIFDLINNDNVVSALFVYAGFTYGPLLGMYAFGFLLNRIVVDKYVPVIAIVSVLITLMIKFKSFGGYQFGFELLIVNGLITFMGMLIFSKKRVLKSQEFVR